MFLTEIAGFYPVLSFLEFDRGIRSWAPARTKGSGTNLSIPRSRRTYVFFAPATGGIRPMHSRLQDKRRVRVGIVGVGNCASSFVQGLTYYRNAKSNEPVPGLMNADVGGYHVSDIEISSAFDVSAEKVGLDIAD